jgi:hypothetical protein
MTPERQKALEAVAEAAREHKAAWPGPDLPDARIKLHAAITALDALPPDPAPAREVVEVRAVVKRDRNTGRLFTFGRTGETDVALVNWCNGYEVVCFLTARVPLPTAPTIAATVLPLTEGGR